MENPTLRFTLTVPTHDLDEFAVCCEEAGWKFHDVGERVTTEDAIDAEAVVVVEAPTPRGESTILVGISR